MRVTLAALVLGALVLMLCVLAFMATHAPRGYQDEERGFISGDAPPGWRPPPGSN